ncbi:hypothetical protein [Pseudomonas fluorescens]|uniref:Uncharacterized protein n=1 Tax=Pseudomonas fluorescens TaxID=294 RepID=A0A5E7HDZ6_PSEFL|nr:hypothetical protein [Pseudomonas fluorescens]VVO62150.1 hypothetical protein PS847_00855 [Pseudomonas fluorescens]
MPGSIDVDFHSKQHSDFDLQCIAGAVSQGFAEPVTAYLTEAFIKSRTCVGVVFGHQVDDAHGTFEDGRIIQTGVVVMAQKEGGYWVLSDEAGSRYVLVTFRREGGSESLLSYLKTAESQPELPC